MRRSVFGGDGGDLISGTILGHHPARMAQRLGRDDLFEDLSPEIRQKIDDPMLSKKITLDYYEAYSEGRTLTDSHEKILRKAYSEEMLEQIKQPGRTPEGMLELVPIDDKDIGDITGGLHQLDSDLLAGKVTRAEWESARDRISSQTVGWKASFSGLCDGSDDHSLMEFAIEAWTTVRKRYWDKHHEWPDTSEIQIGTSLGIDQLYRFADEFKRESAKRIAIFSVTWAEHAFQKLMTSHTYASALMCSDATEDILESIEVPWSAFQVVIPNGILTLQQNGLEVDFTRAMVVASNNATIGAFMILHDPVTKNTMSVGGRTLAQLLFDDVEMHAKLFDPDRGTKVLKLARRLVTGLLLAMQHQDNFKTREVKASLGGLKRDRKAPLHRVTTIGKPISVDCRTQVAAYLSGTHKKNALPSVQTLVRGHYKRQVMGVARAGRRVIWIEPYWRGPEDAPILTKPKKLG